MKNRDNQPNGRKRRHSLIECRLTTDYGQNGENGRILRLFFDDLPKPLRQIHCHHCIIVSIPDEIQRIKRKYGETMTKIGKRKRTTLTCGRPLQREGSGLLFLPISNRYRHRNYGYLRLFNTVVLDVLT